MANQLKKDGVSKELAKKFAEIAKKKNSSFMLISFGKKVIHLVDKIYKIGKEVAKTKKALKFIKCFNHFVIN